MRQDDLSPDCGRIRNELSGLLYDELAPDTRAAIEQHLAACAGCREELTALQDTRRLLARWETPPSGDDPVQLARAVAAMARAPRPRSLRRARLVRWSAVVAGAAAALVFTLSLASARASFADGRFELSFGLPGARPALGPLSGDWRAEAQEIATEVATREVALRTASLEMSLEKSLEASQEELFRRCTEMTQEDLLRLSQAVDYALAQHQETWDTRLTSLGREAARADLETRRALTDLASYLPASQNRR